jgi:hypothetical protein
VLNVRDLKSLLASGNTTITTTGGGTQANDVEFAAAFSWSSGNTLTLDAYHSIMIDEQIWVKNAGGLDLITDDGGTGGVLGFAIYGNVTFANLRCVLSVNSLAYTLVNTIAKLARDIKSDPTGDFALARSYDASRDGIYASSPIPTSFAGMFEGLGNVISNLSIDDTTTSDLVALFSSNLGTIDDLRLTQMVIVGPTGTQELASIVGGLVGLNFGTMSDDYVAGTISIGAGESFANLGALTAANSGTIMGSWSAATVTSGNSSNTGGLVGLNNTGGWIISSGATGTVTGGDTGETGGLTGDNVGVIWLSYATGAVSGGANAGVGGCSGTNVQTGMILDDHATGNVTATNNDAAGGLAGFNYATISGSYALGAITAGAASNMGGLVGASAGSIAGSYATGSVSGTGDYVQGGGLVGSNFGSGTIDSSLAIGPVAAGNYSSVGGLAGNNVGGGASNSYATGNVSGGQGAEAGGFVGYNNAAISDSYSTGAPSGGGGAYEGGLIGYADVSSSIIDAYWDTSTSGVSNLSQGAGNVSNYPGISGLTTAQLQSGLPAGFSASVWAENFTINGGLPYLIDNPPPK